MYVYMCQLECDEVSACHATLTMFDLTIVNKHYIPRFENKTTIIIKTVHRVHDVKLSIKQQKCIVSLYMYFFLSPQ